MGCAETAVRSRTLKGLRCNTHILESLRHLQWRLHHWGHSRAHQSSRQARSVVRCGYRFNLLPWALQTCRLRSYWYVRTLTWRPWGASQWQRLFVRCYFLLAHTVTKTCRPTCIKIAGPEPKQHVGRFVQGLDLYQCLKGRALAESPVVLWPRNRDWWAKWAQVPRSYAWPRKSVWKSQKIRRLTWNDFRSVCSVSAVLTCCNRESEDPHL